MRNTTVQKVIARYNKRAFVSTTVNAMNQFIVDGVRPEFEDKSVLCIKFIAPNDSGNFESSAWFINPIYIEDSPSYNKTAIFSLQLIYAPNTPYGPEMSAIFLPEILELQRKHPELCMLKEYHRFYSELKLLNHNVPSITHDEELQLFLKHIECAKRGTVLNVVLAYYKMKNT